tara:strand:- start:5493 stop:6071 length:579 start_codon:yes stop_codon:yes gene_type:complete
MEVKLTIPNNWNDITIGTYQKYYKIQNSKMSEKNKILKSVALLCDTKDSIVRKMEYSDLLEIVTIIKKLVDTEPSKTNFTKRFKLDKEEYGFIPNMSKLTTGEYIDLETLCKEPIENLHMIMSILFRPVTFSRGDRYTIESYNPDEFREQIFLGCKMDIALGALGFFLTLGEQLAKISLRYLDTVNMTQQKV